MKPNPKILVLILFTALYFCSSSLFAQGTFQTNGVGTDWNNAANWSLTAGVDADGIPDSDDDVTILNDMTTGLASQCNSLVVTANTLTISSIFTVNNTFTQNGGIIIVTVNLTVIGALLQNAGSFSQLAGTIYLRNNITINGTFLAVGGTVEFTGNGNKSIVNNSNMSFYNLINNTAVGFSVSTSSSFYIMNDFTNYRDFDQNGGSITIYGDFDNQRNFIASSGTVIFDGGTTKTITNTNTLTFYNLTIGNTVSNIVQTSSDFIVSNILTAQTNSTTGAFIASGGTITFTTGGGIVSPVVAGTNDALQFWNLIISGTANIQPATGFRVLNNFTNNGSYSQGGGTVSISGNLVNANTIYIASGVTLNISGNLQNNASSFTQNGGTINLTGTLTSTGASFTQNGGNLNVSNNFTITGGSFNSASGTVNFQGATTKTISNSGTLTFNNLSLANTLNNIVQTSSNFTISGVLTTRTSATQGAFIASGSSTITLSGGGGLATPVTSAAASCQFRYLTATGNIAPTSNFQVLADFTNNGTILQNGNTITVAGNLNNSSGRTYTLASGTLNITGNLGENGGTFDQSGGALNINNSLLETGGAFNQSGGTVTINGNMVNSGTINSTNGTVNFDGAGSNSISNTNSLTFYNLTIANTGGNIIASTNNFTISNDFTNYQTFNQSSGTITIRGDFDNSGTYAASAGGVTFEGSSTKTISNSSSLTFFDLAIANTASNVVQTSTGFSIDNNLFVGTAGTFNQVTGGTINILGNINNYGTIGKAAGTLAISGNINNYSNNFNQTGGTITLTGNLTNAAAVNKGLGTFTIQGNFNNSGGTYNQTNGTMTVQGDYTETAGASNISGGTLTLESDFNKSGSGNFSQTNGTVEFQGNLTNNGSLTATGGTARFEGASTKTITNNSNLTFYDFEITSTSLNTVQTSSSFQITNSLSNSASFTQTSGTITILGDLDNSGTIRNTGGYFKFSGSTTKTITNTNSLNFYNLLINNTAGNVVSTGCDFNIDNILTTGTSATSGALIASGSSSIRLSYAGSSSNPVTTSATSLEFQNLEIDVGANILPVSSFRLKGNLTNNGTFTASSPSNVYFVGTSQQTIDGSNAPTFFSLTLNNSTGIELSQSFTFANGGAGSLTLTSGNIDLNGNNIIYIGSQTGTLAETAGNTVINNISSGTGYVTTTSNITVANLNNYSGIGITLSDVSTSSLVTVRRYPKIVCYNQIPSIKRYFAIYSSLTLQSVTISYDTQNELIGTASTLTMYGTTNLIDWTRYSSISNPNDAIGTVTAYSTGASGSPYYLTLFTRAVFFTGDGGDSKWSNRLNWDVGTLPTSNDAVVIGSNEVTVDLNTTINDLILPSATTKLQPSNSGTFNLTVKGNITCGNANCGDPSEGKITGNLGYGKLNIIMTNTVQKTITTGQDGELSINKLIITNGSQVITSGSYRIDIQEELDVQGTGSFVPASGSTINFLEAGSEQYIKKSSLGTLNLSNIKISDGGIVNTIADFGVSGTFTVEDGGKFTATAGIISFSGSASSINNGAVPIVGTERKKSYVKTQSSSESLIFYNLTNSNSLTTNDDFEIHGNFSNSGVFVNTKGTITFDNIGSYIRPKTLTNTGTLTLANLAIADHSYLTTESGFTIGATLGSGVSSLSVSGSGYFKASAGTIIFNTSSTGSETISKSSGGTLEFYNLSIADNSETFLATSSDFIVGGNFSSLGTASGEGAFMAASGIITFKNSSQKTILSTTDNNVRFYHLKIEDVSDIITASSLMIYGDFSVLGSGQFTASSGTITFGNTNTKTITNKGRLTFNNLNVSTSSSVVNTQSPITINGELITGGSAGSGSFIASGSSIITLAYLGNSPISGSSTACQFQNLNITGNLTPTSSFIVKGDFTNNGSFSASSGTVSFLGSSKQLISGTAPSFSSLTINNSSGIKLGTDFTFSSGAAGYLTLTSGVLDLNGNNKIMFGSANGVLAESPGNNITNSVASVGGVLGGYIETASITSASDVASSGIGLSIANGSPPTNLTVRRYHRPRSISGIASINRYFGLTYTGDDLGNVTIEYDNSELNSLNASNLAVFSAESDNPSTWTYHGGTSTEGDATGSVAVTDLTDLGSPVYLAAGTGALTVSPLPISGLHSTNKPVSSPLSVGQSNAIILGFSLESSASTTISRININFNEQLVGKFKTDEFVLKVDDDNDLTTVGSTAVLTDGYISSDGKSISFEGSSFSLPSATKRYYFLYVTVTDIVGTTTPEVFAYFSKDDITVSKTIVNDFYIKSSVYRFAPLNVSVSTANTPLNNALAKGSTQDQAIYGFTLTPSITNSTVYFSEVSVKAKLSGDAASSDFTNIKLWLDVNHNGFVDDGDTQLGETYTSLPLTNILSFAGFTSSFSAASQYLITCQIPESAITDGSILITIQSYADIFLAAPATIPNGGPYKGRIMLIKDRKAPVKLVIKSVYIADPSTFPGLSNGEVITGENVSITVEAQDDSGCPQVVTSSTNIKILNTGFSVIGGDFTATITENQSMVTWNTLTLTNSLGAIGDTLYARVESGMSGLTEAKFYPVNIYAIEPSTSPQELTLTSVTSTTVKADWTNGSSSNNLLVVRKGAEPNAPSNGISYNAALNNNFSTPNSINGTTENGSVVIHSGTGTNTTVRGLSPETKYYFAIYPFTGSGEGTRYKLTPSGGDLVVLADTTTLSNEPTMPASNLEFSKISSEQMQITWTRGNGNKRIVVGRLGSAITSSEYPEDTQNYTANSAFGADGAELGEGFVLYIGDGNTFTVTNLIASTTYYFAVFEYSGSGTNINYLTSSKLSGYRSTLSYEPSIQAHDLSFTFTEDPTVANYSTNVQIKVNWVNGDGTDRIVVAKAESPITTNEFPSDATAKNNSIPSISGESVRYGDYPLGNAYIVYDGSGINNTVTVTGLQYGQTYYFRVFEYNGSGTNSNNSTVNYLTATSQGNPSRKIADRFEPNDSMIDLPLWQYMLTDGTIYTGVISSAEDEDWVWFQPDIENGKENIRINLFNLPQNYTIELYNEYGRLLRRSQKLGKDDEVIVLNNVPAWRYFIRIISPDGTWSLIPYRIKVFERTDKYMSETP